MNPIGLLTEKQISDLETSLNTNKQATDALIAAHFANNSDKEFLIQLNLFIDHKKQDIAELCQKYSETFGKSIDGAKTLGQSSSDIQKRLTAIEGEIKATMASYKSSLEEAVKIRKSIQETDEKLKANLEFQVLIQQLKNINEEIRAGNLYIATIRTLEFANYDSPIASSVTIRHLQKDVDPILAHIESLADKKFSNWMINFNSQCEGIGEAFLNKQKIPPIDLSAVYEYYMMEKALGRVEVFLSIYNDKREKQLKLLRENNKKKTGVDPIDQLFHITAGFFYTEWRISADGFNLLEPARMERMWNETIGYMTREFTQTISHDKVEDMIFLSQRISHFDERMSICSMNSSELQKVITTRGKQFNQALKRNSSIQIKQAIDNSRLDAIQASDTESVQKCAQYNIVSNGADISFIPEMGKVCEIIEGTLSKWLDFTLVHQDSLLVELYEALVTALANAIKMRILNAPSIIECGNLIASLAAFDGALTYFEQYLQKSMASNIKQDKEKLRRTIFAVEEEGAKKLASLFNQFTSELIDRSYLKTLASEPPPHFSTAQLVIYFEAKSQLLINNIPQKIFQTTVENVAKHISDLFVSMIVGMEDISWTPDFIQVVSLNVNHIGNWSALISTPSAKAQINGLIKMLSLLLSSQLSTLAGNPNFMERNKDIPFNAMVAILQRYNPTSKKHLNYLQPNLINNLIAKFSNAQGTPQ